MPLKSNQTCYSTKTSCHNKHALLTCRQVDMIAACAPRKINKSIRMLAHRKQKQKEKGTPPKRQGNIIFKNPKNLGNARRQGK